MITEFGKFPKPNKTGMKKIYRQHSLLGNIKTGDKFECYKSVSIELISPIGIKLGVSEKTPVEITRIYGTWGDSLWLEFKTNKYKFKMSVERFRAYFKETE